MKISDAFPSKYLSAGDLQGRRYTLTIASVALENVSTQDNPEHKPVMYFHGTQKGMVLNKTNSMNVTILYGDETDAWTGKQVELYVTQVPFGDKIVPAIRIMGPQVGVQGGPGMPQSSPLPDGRPTAPPVASQGTGPGLPPQGIGDTLPDDDIPF